MTGLGWGVALLGLAAGAAGLVLSVRLAVRYRELRAALLAAGVVEVARLPAAGGDGAGLPPIGSRAPMDLRMTTTGGLVLDPGYLATGELVVLFLMDRCLACDAQLADLHAALSALPPERPRPVVVLSGPAAENRRYRKVFEPIAHVVEDGPVKSGAGVVMALRVHAFPALLVLVDGTVRRAGTSVAEVALSPA